LRRASILRKQVSARPLFQYKQHPAECDQENSRRPCSRFQSRIKWEGLNLRLANVAADSAQKGAHSATVLRSSDGGTVA